MDELEISGKRYITAKRAAKEHKYHPDYIGQLVRGGKIVGQKVGRVWYVDASALEAYFSGEGFSENADQSPLAEEAVSTATPLVVDESPIEKIPEAVEEPVHIRIETEDVENKFQTISSDVDNTDAATTIGLRYVSDDTALFPGVREKTPNNKAIIEPAFIRAPREYPAVQERSDIRNVYKYIAVLFFSGATVILISFALSTVLTQRLSIDKNGASQSAIAIDASNLLH